VGQLFDHKEIFAFGSGKGGVGKSFLATNVALVLGRKGRKVLLVDADLGGANLHTCLGIPAPEANLSDFIHHNRPIQDTIIRTPFENVWLISGGQDILGIANPKHTQKMRLLKALQEVDVEVVLLDLGAGTGHNTLDFFLVADKGVMVVMPEPTSVENAYRFIKSALYRRLIVLASDPAVRDLVEKASDRRNDAGIRTPAELVEQVVKMDPTTGQMLRDSLKQFRPRIVLNQVRSLADIRIGFAMQAACQKYFGLEVDFVGYLENDDQVWRSIRTRQPLAAMGGGKLFRSFETIAFNLLSNQQLKPE